MVCAEFVGLECHLHRNGSHAYLWSRNAPGYQSLWYHSDWSAVVPAEWSKCDVYFGVHPSRNMRGPFQRARNRDVEVINCVFADFDGEDKKSLISHIISLPLQASCIVDSGGGFHCYWLLEDSLYLSDDIALVRAQRLQNAWVDYVGGDPGAKDLSRVLRVPGTRNFKQEYAPDYPTVAVVSCSLGRVYPIRKLEKYVGISAVASTIVHRRPRREPETGSANLDDLQLSAIVDRARSARNGDIFWSLWTGDTTRLGGDHSAADQALCNILAFWTGGNAGLIDRLFRMSGLYRNKWERRDYRERTIGKAISSSYGFYAGPENTASRQDIQT